MLKNTASSYGTLAKCFHWGIFLLLCLMYGIAFTMEGMQLSPEKIALIGWHKSFGIVVLSVVTLRLLWRFSNPVPQLPKHMVSWQRAAAHFSHWTLYACLFLMPLTGWLMSSAKGIPVSVFGWFILPQVIAPDKPLGGLLKEAHELIAFGLLGLVALHVSAACVHHFYYKDEVLLRMLPAWRRKK